MTDDRDIVERLREPHSSLATQSFIMNEAAAEITQLRAELARRDAEIAAWLRTEAETIAGNITKAAYKRAATAIEAQAYRERG